MESHILGAFRDVIVSLGDIAFMVAMDESGAAARVRMACFPGLAVGLSENQTDEYTSEFRAHVRPERADLVWNSRW